MTLCSTCEKMAASTEVQWKNRQDTMAGALGVSVSPCPSCGSTDWATSREMIKPAPPRMNWLRQLRAPNWQTIRTMNVCLVAIGLLNISMITSNRWLEMMNAAFIGANIMGAITATMMIRTMAVFDRMKELLEETQQLNRALIEGRVRMHIEGLDEPPPIQPRLH